VLVTGAACMDVDATPFAAKGLPVDAALAANSGARPARLPPGEVLRHDGETLALPNTEALVAGRYDLILHFHGSGPLVIDSYRTARAFDRAAVMVVNYGLGSDRYRGIFADGAVLNMKRRVVEERLRERGVQNPDLGRLALSAWSAGFSAIRSALSTPVVEQQVDAVLLLDALHVGRVGAGLDDGALEPFVRFARAAQRGERLMVITHSAVPTFHYASTRESADALLAALGLERKATDRAVPPPELALARSSSADGEPITLKQSSAAERGAFYLFGFDGGEALDHAAQQSHMALTAVPLLAKRWR
jgi:hypothetical protein